MIQHPTCGVLRWVPFRRHFAVFSKPFARVSLLIIHWLTDCLGNLASGLGAADELAPSLTNRLLRFGNLYEVIQAALRAHDCGFRFPGPIHKTAGQLDRTRPLCPYPQVAHYKGTGSIDDASNSTCSLPNNKPPRSAPTCTVQTRPSAWEQFSLQLSATLPL
jgi:hypothetical protein